LQWGGLGNKREVIVIDKKEPISHEGLGKGRVRIVGDWEKSSTIAAGSTDTRGVKKKLAVKSAKGGG